MPEESAFESNTPIARTSLFHDEFITPTPYRDRNWLYSTIKRRDMKQSIPDSESTHLEVSGTMLTFLFRWFFCMKPMASLQSRDGCEALSSGKLWAVPCLPWASPVVLMPKPIINFQHRFFMIFSSCETYYTHSEYNEYLFYRMQITSASIADIFSSRCRPCPNFKAACGTSDEEPAKIDCRFGIYAPWSVSCCKLSTWIAFN